MPPEDVTKELEALDIENDEITATATIAKPEVVEEVIPEYKGKEYVRRDFSPYIQKFLQNQHN
jgi:hypothetical protein